MFSTPALRLSRKYGRNNSLLCMHALQTARPVRASKGKVIAVTVLVGSMCSSLPAAAGRI
jgi:hypothetical protein